MLQQPGLTELRTSERQWERRFGQKREPFPIYAQRPSERLVLRDGHAPLRDVAERLCHRADVTEVPRRCHPRPRARVAEPHAPGSEPAAGGRDGWSPLVHPNVRKRRQAQ